MRAPGGPSLRPTMQAASQTAAKTHSAPPSFRLELTGEDNNAADIFRVTSYIPRNELGSVHSAWKMHSAHSSRHKPARFSWDRHSMWVETQSLPRAARPSSPLGAKMSHEKTVLRPVSPEGMRQRSAGPRGRTHVNALASTEGAGFSGELQSQSELWSRVVLPAITWLYGWIDWHMSSGRNNLPSIVEREHRAAFVAATEHVTEAMRSQSDRLPACIWRATVALLTHVSAQRPTCLHAWHSTEPSCSHFDTLYVRPIQLLQFMNRVENLHGSISKLKKQHGLLTKELEAMRARVPEEHEDSQPEEDEEEETSFAASSASGSSTFQADPGLNRARDTRSESVVGDRLSSKRMSVVGEMGMRTRKQSVFLSSTGVHGGEAESELRDKLVQAQRETLLERTAKEQLEQSMQRLRARCAACSRAC